MYITNKNIEVNGKVMRDKPEKNQSVNIPIIIEKAWETGRVAPTAPQMDNSSSSTWRERKKRIDDALSWLRTELSNLKVQDQQILGQFRRCQDTIEALKLQKTAAWHDDMSEDDLEDEGHWEDWEISEFEKQFAKNLKSCGDIEKQCANLEHEFESRRQPSSSNSSVRSDNQSNKYHHKYSESESSSGSSSYFRQDVEGNDKIKDEAIKTEQSSNTTSNEPEVDSQKAKGPEDKTAFDGRADETNQQANKIDCHETTTTTNQLNDNNIHKTQDEKNPLLRSKTFHFEKRPSYIPDQSSAPDDNNKGIKLTFKRNGEANPEANPPKISVVIKNERIREVTEISPSETMNKSPLDDILLDTHMSSDMVTDKPGRSGHRRYTSDLTGGEDVFTPLFRNIRRISAPFPREDELFGSVRKPMFTSTRNKFISSQKEDDEFISSSLSRIQNAFRPTKITEENTPPVSSRDDPTIYDRYRYVRGQKPTRGNEQVNRAPPPYEYDHGSPISSGMSTPISVISSPPSFSPPAYSNDKGFRLPPSYEYNHGDLSTPRTHYGPIGSVPTKRSFSNTSEMSDASLPSVGRDLPYQRITSIGSQYPVKPAGGADAEPGIATAPVYYGTMPARFTTQRYTDL